MLAKLTEMLGGNGDEEAAEATTTVWVGTVEPKQASKTLSALEKAASLRTAGLEYLRRIVKNRTTGALEVVYGRTRDGHEAHGLANLREQHVAAAFPSTPEAWAAATALWPLCKPPPAPSPTLPRNFDAAALRAIAAAFATLAKEGGGGGSPHAALVVDAEWRPVARFTGGADDAYALKGGCAGAGGGAGDPLAHCVLGAIAAVAEASGVRGVAAAERQKADQYLLTSYSVFCVEEPCVMCVMALLHSRCGRLFFLKRNERFGGAGSVHSVHLDERLNHHFPAYHYADEGLLSDVVAAAAATAATAAADEGSGSINPPSQ